MRWFRSKTQIILWAGYLAMALSPCLIADDAGVPQDLARLFQESHVVWVLVVARLAPSPRDVTMKVLEKLKVSPKREETEGGLMHRPMPNDKVGDQFLVCYSENELSNQSTCTMIPIFPKEPKTYNVGPFIYWSSSPTDRATVPLSSIERWFVRDHAPFWKRR